MGNDSEYHLAKTITIWGSLLGSIIFWGIFLVFVIHGLISEKGWILRLFEERTAVMLFIPLAALASFCNVLILKITDGPIIFEVPGFKFSGAAGPIIMWVISFLAICFGIKLLWPLALS